MALFRPKFAPVQSYVDPSLLNVSTGMGSVLIVVIKLSSFKSGDVKNVRKLKYLYDYFRHSRKRGNTIKLAIIDY